MNSVIFNYIQNKILTYKVLFVNFSYMSILQVFILLTPLFTYPYLTRTLGTELYGLVISAQVLASYATIVVRFGFDSVSARHISINRDNISKLSEIMASILSTRLALWLFCFLVYFFIILIIPIYRNHFILFLFSYGLTLNVLLFPQFFFQGVEQMKFITYINIGIQSVFIILTFIVIKSPSDYVYVPILHSIGYFFGGMISLIIIYTRYGLTFRLPSIQNIKYYLKDASVLFLTDAVCTIKDKLNYLLLGSFVGMSEVVVYDLGSKLVSLANQPLTIINTVIFPKMSKNPSNKVFFRVGSFIFVLIAVLVVVLNVFLQPIVNLFIDEEIPLLPIRIFLLAPLFLGLSSYIGSSYIVARGHSKYMLHSIIFTVVTYVLLLLTMLFAGVLTTVMSFIILAVISYLVEMSYRLYVVKKMNKISKQTNKL